jgi:hypothetical protein
LIESKQSKLTSFQTVNAMPLRFTSTAHPINFKDLSGHDFERLVFATLLRMRAWRSLNWYGQTGGDEGRDIIGVCDDDFGREATVAVACANWQTFTLGKARKDIDRLTSTQTPPPHEVIVIAGGSVSAETKKKCEAHAASKKISKTQVWSGVDFEEHLRFHASSVLSRFFHGETLPDEEQALRDFVLKLDPATEKEAAELLARLFRRPAFTTPIHEESSLPAFRQAIGDTIRALNTGLWHDREGVIISRVPTSQSFSDARVASNLEACSKKLNELRITFDEGVRNGGIRHCSCGKPDCPTFMIDEQYRVRLEADREQVLRHAADALTPLGARLD